MDMIEPMGLEGIEVEQLVLLDTVFPDAFAGTRLLDDENELKKIKITKSLTPTISNVNALPEIEPHDIQRNLAKQITSSVQWEDSIKYIAQEGVGHFIEIGPGKVLKGLIRRIDPSLQVFNIEKPEDIENLSF